MSDARVDCCLAVLHGVPSESCGNGKARGDSNVPPHPAQGPTLPRGITAGLTASLELEEDGDSGDEEGEERRDGDEELEEVLLRGAEGRTTTTSSSSSSGTLLLHWSSCWDSVTSFPANTGGAHGHSGF